MSSAKESTFFNADGQKLFARCWEPSGDHAKEPRALLFITHGFGEHCGRYEKIAGVLTQLGLLVFSHDHAGHGKSEGERAQISTFDIYVRDVFQHIDAMAAKFPGKAIILFGHSMGGTIAILASMERESFFVGTVLSAPAILPNPESATKCKMFLGHIISWISPSCEVIPAIDPKILSHNPEAVADYVNDPLNWHGGVKALWAIAMSEAMEKIKEHMSKNKFPFIVMHGDCDELAMVEGSKMLHEEAGSKDKTLVIFQSYYHEILNEDEERVKSVVKHIIEWIGGRIPKPVK